MELIARAAIAATPGMRNVLDIGCGAGNNSIRLLTEIGLDVDCDLCDLSEPMLIRAQERVAAETTGIIRTFQGDIRYLPLSEKKL